MSNDDHDNDDDNVDDDGDDGAADDVAAAAAADDDDDDDIDYDIDDDDIDDEADEYKQRYQISILAVTMKIAVSNGNQQKLNPCHLIVKLKTMFLTDLWVALHDILWRPLLTVQGSGFALA